MTTEGYEPTPEHYDAFDEWRAFDK